MKEEEIIYTDGHGVKITREKFSVEDKSFYLKGITSIDMQRIPSGNTWAVVFFVLGFLAILAGSLDMLGSFNFYSGDAEYLINGNMLAIGAGVAFLAAGILWMVMAKDKYAVKIGTAEGEKKPFVTKNREHAAIIAASLKKAYYRKTKDTRYDGRLKEESVVIH